ncbi:hypothetical protein B0H14DRAFT_3854618 [Mycena olivaceomarginata]|nr:hypothetical protein B0H14DRAFT_3854618 [Mycena olivaceomarginata]
MSGSGVTYYNEELKMLLRLLKALPDTIPEGDLHDFRHYVLDPIKMKDIGDLLSDKPIDDADAIRSIGEGSKSGGKAKNEASSTV